MAQKANPKKSSVADDPRVTQALQNYEAGLRALQEHKFEKAKPLFEKVLAGVSKELTDRAAIHLSICNQHLERSTTQQFKSLEEHYDYAVSLLNDGHYEDAREQFKLILKENDKADYALYGLAVLSSMTGDSHHCLEHLTEAIRQNPRNRIQARSDSDFQDMADDPRFTELLYPEV